MTDPDSTAPDLAATMRRDATRDNGCCSVPGTAFTPRIWNRSKEKHGKRDTRDGVRRVFAAETKGVSGSLAALSSAQKSRAARRVKEQSKRDDVAREFYCVEDFQGYVGAYDLGHNSLSEVVADLLEAFVPTEENDFLAFTHDMVVWNDRKIVATIRVRTDGEPVATILVPLDYPASNAISLPTRLGITRRGRHLHRPPRPRYGTNPLLISSTNLTIMDLACDLRSFL